MPEIMVYLAAGRSLEQKKGLLRDITKAVTENTGVHPDLVTVQIIETPLELKSKGGIPYSERPPASILANVPKDFG